MNLVQIFVIPHLSPQIGKRPELRQYIIKMSINSEEGLQEGPLINWETVEYLPFTTPLERIAQPAISTPQLPLAAQQLQDAGNHSIKCLLKTVKFVQARVGVESSYFYPPLDTTFKKIDILYSTLNQFKEKIFEATLPMYKNKRATEAPAVAGSNGNSHAKIWQFEEVGKEYEYTKRCL